jgi:hypothetical protein
MQITTEQTTPHLPLQLFLVVVQRLCRVQLVPRPYMRIGQAERLPGQVERDRHKPTYREIDELPDTNISGVT